MNQIAQKQLTDNSLVMFGPFEVCADYVARFWKETTRELRDQGVNLDDKIKVTFGIKKFPLDGTDESKSVQAVANYLGSGHHAVILKLEDKDKCALKLELVVEHIDAGMRYINNSFKCPDDKCNFQSNFFSKLADHHFSKHVGPKGEEVNYECCGNVFRNFQSYCQHQYNNHVTKQAVTLKFEKIRENNFENFLDHVQYFGANTKNTTMREVMQCAVDIILNFGRYWVHCWNCQDFATWFLVLVGVPLRNIDPTFADKITGSGTQSNARSIQQSKESYVYKTQIELEKHDFTELKGGARCNEIGCKWLPPMSIEALTRHIDLAHKCENISGSSLVDFFEDFLYIVSGENMGLDIDIKLKRRYSLYQLRGSDICSHTSVVFSPWTSDIDSTIHKFDFYHTAEMVIDGKQCKPFVRTISEKQHLENLRYICDINISTEELFDYMHVIYKYTFHHSSGDNCMDFFDNLLYGLKDFRQRQIIVPSVQKGLTAEYEEYSRLTDVLERRNMLLQIFEFHTRNEEFQGEITIAKSSFMYGLPKRNTDTSFEKLLSYGNAIKYSAATKFNLLKGSGKEKWVCLHPLIAMFLMSFYTIGELFFPLFLVCNALLLVSFGLPLRNNMHELHLFLKYLKQPKEWLNIPLLARDVLLVVSLIVLAYEVVIDNSMLMSAYILHYLWIICITLDGDVFKRILDFHKISLKTIPNHVLQLIEFSTRNTILRCLVAIGFIIPLESCPYIISCLILFMIIISYVKRFAEYIFTGGLPISLFTCQYVRILNHFIVFLYLLAIASIGIQGVIRIPVFQLSKYHCFAIYIYTSLSWYSEQEDKLHICKCTAVTYAKAFEIDGIMTSHEKPLLRSWLLIFNTSIVTSLAMLRVVSFVPIICLCVFDVHICLFITFVALYLHCTLLMFTIDFHYVITVLFRDPLEKLRIKRKRNKRGTKDTRGTVKIIDRK